MVLHIKLIRFILIVVIILIAIFIIFKYELQYYFYEPKWYTAEHFGIETVKSDLDYNGNGIDDYTDILLGAKKEAKNKPQYVNAYYDGGYPPDNEGVCTDMIWRSLQNAGYNLKDLIDKDISRNISKYPRTNGVQDRNIDFRRVANVKVFCERYALSLTLDLNEIDKWQPGDIVTFGIEHIGIISDKRNEKGIPWLIHNAGQPNREEDVLETYSNGDPLKEISGHFRFDIN